MSLLISTLYMFIVLFFCYSTVAIPLIGKRPDIDDNGIPDWCNFDKDGTAHCLISDGSWAAVPPSTSTADRTASSVTAPGSSTTSNTVLTVWTSSSTIKTASSIIRTTASTTQTTSWSTSTLTSSSIARLPTGSLPSSSQFKADNGTKWRIEYVGDVQYTGDIGKQNLVGDKCRTSQLGDKVIWNCGDMMCAPDYTVCGFAMGPAMYGTDDVMTINTTGISYINNNDFLNPWSGDSSPQIPQSFWGMDQSNVAPLNDTHGVVYGFQIWRGASDGSFVPRGNAVGIVTLGEDKPVATRMGPLLTGPDALGMGLLAILRDQNYIYLYTQSESAASRLVVTRVTADSILDASKYESLQAGNTTWLPSIPSTSDTKYGMVTANPNGQFGCEVYGSVFYSNYFNKYVIVCSIFMSYTNMYTSDTPYGPWSEEFGLLNGWNGYGSMVHPMYSPGGSHKELYFSQGPNLKFNMFKITFNY